MRFLGCQSNPLSEWEPSSLVNVYSTVSGAGILNGYEDRIRFKITQVPTKILIEHRQSVIDQVYGGQKNRCKRGKSYEQTLFRDLNASLVNPKTVRTVLGTGELPRPSCVRSRSRNLGRAAGIQPDQLWELICKIPVQDSGFYS